MARDDAWIASDIDGYLAAHERKELVRFVVVGSVDDGKSTLIGRLLYETDSLYEDQISQVKRASRQDGGELDFSLFTDGLRAEREQGITIDVAYRYFSTQRRKFIIADTPGHVEYTRNMATGASTAELAVILLDARLGVLPQSRRHAYIASLLGIPRLLVAVNKMDLVRFDDAVFTRIREEFSAFATKLGFDDVLFVPISAKDGDNIVARSERTPWFTGQTVLEMLETVPLGRASQDTSFRFPVQYVIRPHLDYRGFAGQIASGEIGAGDEVVVLPSGKRTKVKSIDTFEGPIPRAFAPMSVTLRLADEVDVSRGDMLVKPDALATPQRRFDAMLVWLSEGPLDPEREYLVKHTSRTVPARLDRVRWRLEMETLGEVPAERLGLNDIGRVSLQCSRPLLLDAYAKNRGTGALIVIDALTNNTVAAGVVLEGEAGGGLGKEEPEEEARGGSRITAEERKRRLGQGGAVLYLDGQDERAARQRAFALERTLFDHGFLANVVFGAEAARACAAAGLFSICVGLGPSEERARLRASLRVAEVPLLELAASEDAGLEGLLEALAEQGALERPKEVRQTA